MAIPRDRPRHLSAALISRLREIGPLAVAYSGGANGRDRCYFCKSEVLDTLALVAREHGYERLATGTNADDAADPHRPGINAGCERGVYTPLLEVGLAKADVRAISRLWSLPTFCGGPSAEAATSGAAEYARQHAVQHVTWDPEDMALRGMAAGLSDRRVLLASRRARRVRDG